MKIRDAGPADVARHRRARARVLLPALVGGDSRLPAQRTRARYCSPREIEGELAGYMGLQYVLDEGYISNVCTAPRVPPPRRGKRADRRDDKPRRARWGWRS